VPPVFGCAAELRDGLDVEGCAGEPVTRQAARTAWLSAAAPAAVPASRRRRLNLPRPASEGRCAVTAVRPC
jgi:hypothetical protein